MPKTPLVSEMSYRSSFHVPVAAKMSDKPSARPLALVGNTFGPLLSTSVDSLLRAVVLELSELEVDVVDVVVALLDFVDDVAVVDDSEDCEVVVVDMLVDDDAAAALPD